ncbi:MAG: hypothetical protein RML94_11510, partial [Bacteroidia bacterium]|nr:hypothetical protein [Bacteroidia bacterium]
AQPAARRPEAQRRDTPKKVKLFFRLNIKTLYQAYFQLCSFIKIYLSTTRRPFCAPIFTPLYPQISFILNKMSNILSR